MATQRTGRGNTRSIPQTTPRKGTPSYKIWDASDKSPAPKDDRPKSIPRKGTPSYKIAEKIEAANRRRETEQAEAVERAQLREIDPDPDIIAAP